MVPACNFELALKKMLIASLLLTTMLSACGRPGGPVSSDVPVSVHAVNYSNEEFQYTLEDPADPSNLGGGEAIGRFAAGGTMCCYSLPKKWRPGMKVKLNFELYFPNPSGGDARKMRNVELVDLPRYIKPEELWVVRDEHGVMGIVLSNYQPDHPMWPGKAKGWPTPSLAYQRERWNLYLQHELGGIRVFEEMQKSIDADPVGEARKAWSDEMKYHPELKGKFSGPEDPGFITYLKQDYERAIERSRMIVRQLEESKP